MRNITDAVRHLYRRKTESVMKIITLSSGIIIGMVLIARISFDLSHDSWIPQVRNLYQIQSLYTTQAGTENAATTDYSNTLQPVAPTAAVEIPGVESGTSILKAGERVIFRGEDRYEAEAIYADSTFFSTLRLPVLRGEEKSLGQKGNAFLSGTLARQIFGDTDPIGQLIFTDKTQKDARTVTGIFKDIPYNSHLSFDLVFSPVDDIAWTGDWNRSDGFTGYIRLSPEADPQAVDRALPEMMRRHMDLKLQSDMGYSFSAYMKPVRKLHISDDEIRLTLIVLSLFVILLLASVSLNYVMTSISSLDTRARNIAIFKCMGATSRDISVSMMWETAIIMAISAGTAVLVLYAGSPLTERLTGMKFSDMFSSWQLPGYIAGVLFILSVAVLATARIFSGIPAIDIFRTARHGHTSWKRIMLFIQVACSAVILGFLGTAISQYRLVAQKDMGYDTDCLAYCLLDSIPLSGRQMLRQELMKCPYIRNVAFSNDIPVMKFSGMQLVDPDSGGTVCTCRYTFIDPDFVSTTGIRLVEGTNVPAEMSGKLMPAIVSRSFVTAVGMDGSPVGKIFPQNGISVTGVFEDFTMQSVFLEQDPVCLITLPEQFSRLYMTIRFSEITPDALTETENLIRTLSPENDVVLRTYRDDIHQEYNDTERLRNSVATAAVFMLFITLMGLGGYVVDEMRSKRKETAIRKINGASVFDILKMMLRETASICLPAIAAGSLAAVGAASFWLRNFPEKVHGTGLLCLLAAAILATLTMSCAAASSLRAAKENPTKCLSSE